MQSKDFDKSIRDLLNGHTPEYNPADWDRMEDMLQNLPGAGPGSSSSGAGGTAGSAAKGLAALGGKAWVVAAMVGLTAVNVAVLYSAADKEENSEAAATDTTQPAAYITEKTEDQVPEAVAFQPENASPVNQTTTTAALAPSVESSFVTNGTENRSVNQHAAPGAKPSADKGFIAAGQGLAPSAGSSFSAGLGLNTPSTGAAANAYAGGGQSGAGSGAFVSPCESNNKPYLPYLIAGLDTVTSLSFTLTACEPFCLRLPARDKDPGDRILFSANLLQFPGARFEPSPEQPAEASFCWTPTAGQARAETYTLRVNLQNQSCPGVNPVLIHLKVMPSAAVRILGDSLLMAGQQTRLKAVGNMAEATWQWLQAPGLEGSRGSMEVTAAPVRTTTYTLQATNASGCMLQATHKVRVIENAMASEVFIPNIFTPNGDNINDYFEVKGIEPGQMELTVIDRSSRTVYRNPHYDNTWNGNGLADGRYTYVLKNLITGKTWRSSVEISRR